MPCPSSSEPVQKRQHCGLRTLFALCFYLALSVAFWGRASLGHLGRLYLGRNADPHFFMWCLAWWPYAIGHRLSPFSTQAVFAPNGLNLAWTNSIPAVGLLMAPVTLTMGPVVSYNVLSFLAPAVAAWTAYLLCKEITGAFWPSTLAGYVFGFSSYELGHLPGHTPLALTALVPLCPYLVLRSLTHSIRARTFVVFMTATLTAQFLTSKEVFATLTAFGVTTMAMAFFVLPKHWRDPLASAVKLTILAYTLTAILMTPYLWALATGDRPVFPVGQWSAVYSTDLLNLFVPTSTNLFGWLLSHSIADTFRGNTLEQGGYLGMPLVLLLIFTGRIYWHRPIGKMLILSLITAAIATLGPQLHIAGTAIMPLPWALVTHVPLLRYALPDRFIVYAWLGAAVALALWLTGSTPSPWVRWSVALVSVLVLLPNPSPTYWRARVDTPSFFSSGAYKHVFGPTSTVLVIPYGPLGDSMVWQAESSVDFRLAEGDVGYIPASYASWPILDTLVCATLIPDAKGQFRAFLASHRVNTVLVRDGTPGPWAALLDGLDARPLHTGEVTIYHVPSSPRTPFDDMDSVSMEQRATAAQFGALVSATQRYLSRGAPLSELSVQQLEAMRLLPQWGCAGSNVSPPTSFWTHSSLWVGAGPSGTIGVAIARPFSLVEGVAKRYRADALSVYFPYPTPIGDAVHDVNPHTLLMVFNKTGLARAATEADGRDTP